MAVLYSTILLQWNFICNFIAFIYIMNYLPGDTEVQVSFLSSLLDDIPSLTIGSNQNFGVLGEAFHSDDFQIQALPYHRHHELVTECHLLHYNSHTYADGPVQFLKVNTDVLNTQTHRSQLHTSLFILNVLSRKQWHTWSLGIPLISPKQWCSTRIVANVEQRERVTYIFSVTTHSSFTNPLIMCINFERAVKL